MSILGNKALKEALNRHFLCFEASFKAFTDILFMMTIKSFKLQLSLGDTETNYSKLKGKNIVNLPNNFFFAQSDTMRVKGTLRPIWKCFYSINIFFLKISPLICASIMYAPATKPLVSIKLPSFDIFS
jgi:hypothetical protein